MVSEGHHTWKPRDARSFEGSNLLVQRQWWTWSAEHFAYGDQELGKELNCTSASSTYTEIRLRGDGGWSNGFEQWANEIGLHWNRGNAKIESATHGTHGATTICSPGATSWIPAARIDRCRWKRTLGTRPGSIATATRKARAGERSRSRSCPTRIRAPEIIAKVAAN